MLGAGIHSNNIWAVTSGWASDITGSFDLVADAAYHKKQIEGIMHAWDGDVEVGIDRMGADFASYATSDPLTCRAWCIGNTACRAWTHYNGTCFLKDAIPSWTALAGATSGLSPNRPSAPELDYDRPGADYNIFAFSGSDSICIDQCSIDYRCQAYTITAGTTKTCYLKQEAPTVVYRPGIGIKSAPKRGMRFEWDRQGAVFHSFTYSTPSPEICQSECAKYSQCASWAYAAATMTTSPTCWLQTTAGSLVPAHGFVSGLKSQMYR
jgi:hypothetical protein